MSSAGFEAGRSGAGNVNAIPTVGVYAGLGLVVAAGLNSQTLGLPGATPALAQECIRSMIVTIISRRFWLSSVAAATASALTPSFCNAARA